jgi:prolyl 4-hydroxylase
MLLFKTSFNLMCLLALLNLSCVRQRKINYAQTNFGVTQLVAGTEEEVLQIKTQLQEVDNYARHTVTMMDKETRDLCHNNLDQCTFWASEKKCRGTDLEFMMKHCPLACMDCHVVKSFHRCADKRDPISKPSISTNGGIDEIFESIIASKGTAFSKYGPEVLVMPNENEEGNDSWIIRLDSFLTTEEADGLIQLGNTLGWKPTVQDDDIEDRNPKNRVPFRRSESSMCDSDENGSCSGNELYQRIIERIATITGVPTSHFEPMDMVKYGYADSYGVHHDIRVHDVWMPAGPRILSLFVDLTDVEEGGATGFPDLDWLFVKAKKGQALLWSNVLRSDPTNMNPKMYHEALPVVEGEKYGANFWLHLYDWQDAKSQDCINSK